MRPCRPSTQTSSVSEGVGPTWSLTEAELPSQRQVTRVPLHLLTPAQHSVYRETQVTPHPRALQDLCPVRRLEMLSHLCSLSSCCNRRCFSTVCPFQGVLLARSGPGGPVINSASAGLLHRLKRTQTSGKSFISSKTHAIFSPPKILVEMISLN